MTAARRSKRRGNKRRKRAPAKHKASFASASTSSAPAAASEPARAGAAKTKRAKRATASLAARAGYDAEHAPAPGPWLDSSESERLARVQRYHELALEPADQPPSASLHAGLHVMVENQLATNQPPQARAALGRLMAEGLSRHNAIHAIAWLAGEHLKQAQREQRLIDPSQYASDLDQLTRQSWLAMAQG
jgi:hypothetical protein